MTGRKNNSIHREKSRLVTRSLSADSAEGHIDFPPFRWSCALGRAGRRAIKREGDSATPAGHWSLQKVLYRPDRVNRPRTALPCRAIRPSDGWCDAPEDRNYNRPVNLPYPTSTESLWRDDHIYDLIITLDHNQRPRQQYAGSAIFIHLARPDFTPTEGCIALRPRDIRLLLSSVREGAVLEILP